MGYCVTRQFIEFLMFEICDLKRTRHQPRNWNDIFFLRMFILKFCFSYRSLWYSLQISKEKENKREILSISFAFRLLIRHISWFIKVFVLFRKMNQIWCRNIMMLSCYMLYSKWKFIFNVVKVLFFLNICTIN